LRGICFSVYGKSVACGAFTLGQQSQIGGESVQSNQAS
jgi:hypothetical protein